jgi:hypothetical protein
MSDYIIIIFSSTANCYAEIRANMNSDQNICLEVLARRLPYSGRVTPLHDRNRIFPVAVPRQSFVIHMHERQPELVAVSALEFNPDLVDTLYHHFSYMHLDKCVIILTLVTHEMSNIL